ncbi:MAG: hypothetical protein A2912_03730 [Candidatus Buchananbacteria bacterium RIFCSPLOWO2_01_FULL_40_23b]|uniref:Phosphatidic acid phosphatase type 2/haloperoxidase domain-containing protein n=1 Tax=Candidatus Buchananbacteria bacterium RIFCSPLOWO2_01_FULL_40_23b TaxID=1797544 RepID=A0A1G1YMH1_9BACT|nr:MAG: hypothetical protein A2912_03730 [Candidatus Buchananbacteria bacterium RIFCSPLOWO2_01_FULL_40_23b]
MLYALIIIFPAAQTSLSQTDIAQLNTKLDQDRIYLLQLLDSSEKNIQSIQQLQLSQRTLDNTDTQTLEQIRYQFNTLLDHLIALDLLINDYRSFYQISIFDHKEEHQQAFLIGYSAYITKYKLTFDFLKEVNNNKYIETVLNEKSNQLDQSFVYYYLKKRLNYPKNIIMLNAGKTYLHYTTLPPQTHPDYIYLKDNSRTKYYQLLNDVDYSFTLGRKSLADLFEKNTMESWMPVQTKVANYMGDTRLTARHENFISLEQAQQLSTLLKPGDILIQRRNWYISNAGQPGYWTHAAIYTGTLDEIDTYFQDTAPPLFNTSFKEYIHQHYPQLYLDHQKLHHEKYQFRTIEAIGEGVVLESIEESGRADSLAVLRPKLTKQEKLNALLIAFNNYGKPYDFNFDFSTDDTVVCSELVYKAYLPNTQTKGVHYNLTYMAGRPIVTPNDMIKAFDTEYNTPEQQLDLVIYLEANEYTQTAQEKDVTALRTSWQKPKFSVQLLYQETFEQQTKQQKKELAIVTYFNKLFNPELNTFSLILSSKLFLLPFFLLICGIIYFIDRKNARKIIFILVLAIILNLFIAQILIKETTSIVGYERLRPYLIDPQIEPIGHPYTDSSFPSIHTTLTVTLSAILFYFYRKTIFVSIPILILIGFSRLHNGMHYPTDIIVGIIFGIILAITSLKLAQHLLKQKKIKKYF